MTPFERKLITGDEEDHAPDPLDAAELLAYEEGRQRVVHA